MDAFYRIEHDVPSGLMSVTLSGFFTIDDAAALRSALEKAIFKLGRAPGDHVSLFDIRECKIQSQDVVRALRAMSDVKKVVARRVAIVTGGSLMRMQLPRILVDRNARCFDSLWAARRWLLEKPNSQKSIVVAQSNKLTRHEQVPPVDGNWSLRA